MSDNDKRTSTAASSSDAVAAARREADEKIQRERAAREAAALEQGKTELVASEVSALDTEADRIRQEIARKTPAEERAEARARAPGHILLLLLIFLICYLIAAATGHAGIISFPGTRAADSPAPLTAALGGTGQAGTRGAAIATSYEVAPVFRDYYQAHSGERVFGRPISGLVQVGGREAQWFERSRLEYWPEHKGTAYEVQPALVGVEFTQNVPFPNQQFFPSNPEVVYSPITNHGVSERFYTFWEQNGGLDVFGYPLSDELQERFGEKMYTVQYFQRARLEYHPDAGDGSQILIGLLGHALYFQDSAPNIVSAAKPTPVPVVAP